MPRKWSCLYCGHPLGPNEHCPLPECVEARAAARRRMGVDDVFGCLTIQRVSTGKIHLVYAGGGPSDGSLYGFYTLCGYPIKDIAQWIEFESVATCKRCLARVREGAINEQE